MNASWVRMESGETYRDAHARVFEAVRVALGLPANVAYKRIELSIGVGEAPSLKVTIDPLFAPGVKRVMPPLPEPVMR